MDMNESERDNDRFAENMLEAFKALEGMPLKDKDGKEYIIKKINGISTGYEFIIEEN